MAKAVYWFENDKTNEIFTVPKETKYGETAQEGQKSYPGSIRGSSCCGKVPRLGNQAPYIPGFLQGFFFFCLIEISAWRIFSFGSKAEAVHSWSGEKGKAAVC